MKEIRLLTKSDIEVKVKQVTEKGAVALLYKTARTDMQILDETYGALFWQTDYKEVKGNLYCGIGVRNGDGCFVWKWDCGIESREDGEGNEKKGEASDAFKRAGFKWGIGRELYTAPFIFIKAETYEKNGKYYLKNKFAKYSVSVIEYDELRNINKLVIVDENGNNAFTYGTANKGVMAQPSHEKPKVGETADLTLVSALNMTFKNKAGKDVKLKELDVIDLARLSKNEDPKWSDLRKAATIILEYKANGEGADNE